MRYYNIVNVIQLYILFFNQKISKNSTATTIKEENNKYSISKILGKGMSITI